MSEMSTPPENSTFSHSWTITDLSGKLVSSVEHPCITSLSFPSTSPNTKSPVFRLSLYPKGINVNFSDYLSIGFGAVSHVENDDKITVRYRVSLIDSKGERRYTKEWLYIFTSSKRVSVFGRFIPRSELFCPSNGLLTDDKLVIHCEGTVLGEPTALDYANTNLTDLKFIASSRPNLMVDMLYSLTTKHRLTYYSPEGVPNFEIQNQVDETFSYSYKAKMYDDEIFTWSHSKYMKSTEELKLLSRQEMLNLLSFWVVSGKHAELFLVLQCDGDGEKVMNLHKIVLLNRTTEFDVLLQNSRVTLPIDVPSKVFDQLIHYLYTGKVPLLKQYRYELLTISCEYDLDVLKQMCELSICEQITTENAIHLLTFATTASGDLLKRAALEYITDHATELLFELPDSLKPELIEEMYRNLSLKNVLNEIEDRQVYENFQPSIVSNEIEESISYTRLKTYHLFNEFTFSEKCCDGQRHKHTLSAYESPEFCSLENLTLKFKLDELAVDTVKGSDFDLMIKDCDSRRFDLSEPQVLLISYKMSLSMGSDSLGTCDDIQYVNISSNYSRLHNKLRIQNLNELDSYSEESDCEDKFSQWYGKFKIRSEITVLCGISALDMSPIQGFTQLELEQSRKHLLECFSSSMLKSDDDDKCDVTLVVRGTEFKVHSIFLAQSSVFAALVPQSNQISIPDLTIEAFESFVQYLYTGKVQSLDKYAKQLLIVASKYKLKILEQMCQLQTKFQSN